MAPSKNCCSAEVGADAVKVNACFCIHSTGVPEAGLAPSPLIMDINDLAGEWYGEKDTKKCCASVFWKGCNNNMMCQCCYCGPMPCCFAIWYRQCGGWSCDGWSNTFDNQGHRLTVIDKDTMLCATLCHAHALVELWSLRIV